MAMAISNAFHCPKLQFNRKNYANRVSVPYSSPSSFVRFSSTVPWRGKVTCSAASAAGSSNSDSDFNPYEVLGVSPIVGFDKIKVTYTRKLREAERSGDEAAASRLVKAYDKLMMAQLKNRKDGLTYGSLKVSKDIKYADKQPIVPWGPRSSKSSQQDTRINMAITAVFTAWVFIQQNAEYKPLQFLTFVFVYRIFEKLKSTEPTVSPTLTEDGEDSGRGVRMGKRLLRSLALAFGCVAFASLGYTGIVNLIEYLAGFVPSILYNNQEVLVTISSAIFLYIIATYYR